MKNLITSIASLLLLLAILVQFTQSQLLDMRLTAAEQSVASFRDTAKMEGYISDNNEGRLRRELLQIFGCTEEEISITGGRTPAVKGELISYEVQVKVKNVIVMAGFWNIDKTKNCFSYRVHRTVVSECEEETP